MRRKDKEITDLNEIRKIIDDTMTLHLGLFDKGYPYIVPLHYGYEFAGSQLILYMHSAKEGHKLDLIQANPAACVEIENNINLISGGDVACAYGSTFNSVIAFGKVEPVSESSAKIHAIEAIMLHQTGRDFEIDEKMADSVEVLRFTADSYTGKHKVMPR